MPPGRRPPPSHPAVLTKPKPRLRSEHKRPVRTNHHHRSNTMADSGGLSANNAAAANANEDDDANTAPFPDTVRLCFLSILHQSTFDSL